MLRLPASVRIFLCLEPTDMRRSFDGLSGMVQSILEQSPTCGHLFVFRNRRRDRLKVLWWDRDGFAIFYKRLEKGVFHFPVPATHAGKRCEIDARDFAMLVEGLRSREVKKSPRFRTPSACAIS
jgi:transposase